jgi:hypothetical protein
MTLRLWSLWEIMKVFESTMFFILLRNLQDFHDRCDEARRRIADGTFDSTEFKLSGKAKPSQAELKMILDSLSNLAEVCKKTELASAHTQVSLIHLHIECHQDDIEYPSLTSELRNAIDAVMMEFCNRRFIEVPKGCNDCINNRTLFGEQVQDSFKSAAEDIEEAGNCLACGCNSACVFHLMRVAEYGLRALARDRRIVLPKNKPLDLATWEDILKELDKAEDAIKNFPKTLAREAQFDFIHGAMMEFKRFKNKFRNQIMHTRKSYDRHQAMSAFDHVKAFMEILASRISETKRTPVVWKGSKWVKKSDEA